MTFSGRTALVTGSGRNIGRAIALAFATAGINLAVNVRQNTAQGEAVAKEARAFGVEAAVITGDIADPSEDARMVAEIESALGPVDYLVDCASPRQRLSFLEISVEDWQAVLGSTLSSTFYLSRLVLPGMAERNFGRIIAIGGAVTTVAVPRFAHVVAAKHGLAGLVKAIAVEFGASGVTANVVSPGWTDTPRDAAEYPVWPPPREQLAAMLSIPRLGQPDEIATACLFLASDEAGYITGQDLQVNGGLRAV